MFRIWHIALPKSYLRIQFDKTKTIWVVCWVPILGYDLYSSSGREFLSNSRYLLFDIHFMAQLWLTHVAFRKLPNRFSSNAAFIALSLVTVRDRLKAWSDFDFCFVNSSLLYFSVTFFWKAVVAYELLLQLQTSASVFKLVIFTNLFDNLSGFGIILAKPTPFPLTTIIIWIFPSKVFYNVVFYS